MRNTWVQTVEARNVDDKMLNEDAVLLNYYADAEFEKLQTRIEEISQVVIDEFWRPEAFTHSDEYRQHMMYWKEVVDVAIPRQVAMRIGTNYTEGSLFKFVMLSILSDIESYNNLYTKLFYGEDQDFSCGCKVCYK